MAVSPPLQTEDALKYCFFPRKISLEGSSLKRVAI